MTFPFFIYIFLENLHKKRIGDNPQKARIETKEKSVRNFGHLNHEEVEGFI